MVTYKHEVGIQEVKSSGKTCPPGESIEIDCKPYRWVTNPIDQECFKPQALRNPLRLSSAKDSVEKCSCWGLSMHESLEQSIVAFQRLEKTFKKARKAFGGWVAKGQITKQDGKCTKANTGGHFDLFEYAGSSIDTSFSIVQEVPSR